MILEGRTVLVVGVGPGLGASCARLALRDGANVAVMARNAGRLREAAAGLDPAGERIIACPGGRHLTGGLHRRSRRGRGPLR